MNHDHAYPIIARISMTLLQKDGTNVKGYTDDSKDASPIDHCCHMVGKYDRN